MCMIPAVQFMKHECHQFSYFVSRRPKNAELEECNVLLMTPGGPRNSHSDVYARNEENMMDWEGNMGTECG